jgi:hypothetical protein
VHKLDLFAVLIVCTEMNNKICGQACFSFSLYLEALLGLADLLVYTLESVSVYFYDITFKYFIRRDGMEAFNCFILET